MILFSIRRDNIKYQNTHLQLQYIKGTLHRLVVSFHSKARDILMCERNAFN